MDVKFSASPGTTLQAKSLPNGQMIRGIQIDNPSGNWLYVVSEKLFCPPYTIGWAIPTTYDQSSITVEARLTGPASQVGTNQGENWELALFDEPQSPSAGTPYQFIGKFTGNLTASGIAVRVDTAPVSIVSIAGIAEKRLRIKQIIVHSNITDASLQFRIRANGTTDLFWFTLRPPQTQEAFTYPDGLDFGLGESFDLDGFMTFIVGLVDAIVIYQVI